MYNQQLLQINVVMCTRLLDICTFLPADFPNLPHAPTLAKVPPPLLGQMPPPLLTASKNPPRAHCLPCLLHQNSTPPPSGGQFGNYVLSTVYRSIILYSSGYSVNV
jgi:hypothetical protein